MGARRNDRAVGFARARLTARFVAEAYRGLWRPNFAYPSELEA